MQNHCTEILVVRNFLALLKECQRDPKYDTSLVCCQLNKLVSYFAENGRPLEKLIEEAIDECFDLSKAIRPRILYHR